ncbi:Os08g0408300, partial [Oryza sativa Japonica Group]
REIALPCVGARSSGGARDLAPRTRKSELAT